LGYTFDGIAPETFLTRMSVDKGRLVLPDGMSYELLVLPERDTITPRLLRKVDELVRAGATVIGPRPLKSPSLAGYPGCDAAVQTLAEGPWANCTGRLVTDPPNAQSHPPPIQREEDEVRGEKRSPPPIGWGEGRGRGSRGGRVIWKQTPTTDARQVDED